MKANTSTSRTRIIVAGLLVATVGAGSTATAFVFRPARAAKGLDSGGGGSGRFLSFMATGQRA